MVNASYASNKVIHNNHKIFTYIFFTEANRYNILCSSQKNMMKLLGAKVMLEHFEKYRIIEFSLYTRKIKLIT